MRKIVLDNGYVELKEAWGSDQSVIEAARMSVDKGFLGWGPFTKCKKCGLDKERGHPKGYVTLEEMRCQHEFETKLGDEKLLRFLWENQHSTPFEMAGLRIEVQAPIMVFREWHRHRTFSYSELSARYTQMPDLHYVPTLKRVKEVSLKNKQAAGIAPLAPDDDLENWLGEAEALQDIIYNHYERGLKLGIAKEVARINTPVSRYSRMQASANLLNWTKFLRLRMASNAQYEIRMFANAVGEIVGEKFPRTWGLFLEGFKP